ncbi:MAG: Tetratricopeptide repeat protein [Mucilaginibacter sp.]|nr:Tetratricopeptide repeat protein [Mucilaginibacter sp.]
MRLAVIISFFIVSSIEPILAQNAYVRLGKQAFIDGDFRSAVFQLEKACLIDSTNSNALWMLGYSYYHSSNYLKSITAFTKEISITPTDAYAYYYRARAKSHLGKDMQLSGAEREKYLLSAIFDYTKAISINPNDSKVASFYQNRGLAYREYGVFKLDAASHAYDRGSGIKALRAAIDDLQRVLTNDPSRVDIVSLIDLSKEKLASTVGHH